MSLDALWSATIPDRIRPDLYAATELNESGHRPLTDVADFIVNNVSKHTSDQLYVLAANNQQALQLAQQEWMQLESIANQIKNHDLLAAPCSEPQSLPSNETFEEVKESILYRYKYESKRKGPLSKTTPFDQVSEQEKLDLRDPPEPFAQAGLIPSDKQFKAIMTSAKAAGHELNPDSFQPYATNYAFEARPSGRWIPKVKPAEAPPPPRTRARAARLTALTDDVIETNRSSGERAVASREPFVGVSGLSTPIDGSPMLKKRRLELPAASEEPRKKHPNQYTKRREAEAAARADITSRTAMSSPAPYPAALAAANTPRKKHPNQHTKRREREEAERLAAAANMPQPMSQPAPMPIIMHQVQTQKPLPQPLRPSMNPPDFQSMTDREKESYSWTPADLVECIKYDHHWLNPDPKQALKWKEKILGSDYPVRTYAMLKKWKYWHATGGHKRPRNTSAAINGDHVGSAPDHANGSVNGSDVDPESEHNEAPRKTMRLSQLLRSGPDRDRFGNVINHGAVFPDRPGLLPPPPLDTQQSLNNMYPQPYHTAPLPPQHSPDINTAHFRPQLPYGVMMGDQTTRFGEPPVHPGGRTWSHSLDGPPYNHDVYKGPSMPSDRSMTSLQFGYGGPLPQDVLQTSPNGIAGDQAKRALRAVSRA